MSKETRRIWRENNKDKIQQRMKIYTENNKDDINEKRRQVKQEIFDCGGTFKNTSSKNVHLKTKMHKKYIEDLNKTQ